MTNATVNHPYLLFSFGNHAQCILKPERETRHAIFIRERTISTDQLDWTLKPFLRSQAINQFQTASVYSNPRKDDSNWIELVSKNFRIHSKKFPPRSLLKPIQVRWIENNQWKWAQIGYSANLNHIRVVNLIRLNSHMLKSLAGQNLKPHVLVVSKSVKVDSDQLIQLFGDAVFIFHHGIRMAGTHHPGPAQRNPYFISMIDYPLIRLKMEGRMLLAEIGGNKLRNIFTSELPQLP